MTVPIEVPPLVAQRAHASGAIGRRWLAELPELVRDLSARWDLETGPTFPGGTASLVVAAADRAGRACVLKIGMPAEIDAVEAFEHGVTAHRLANGRGCAALLAHDAAVPAVLLERLGPNLHELRLPIPTVLETIVATLRRFWRPIPVDAGLPTGADRAAWLSAFVTTTWEQLGRPCERRVIDAAVAYCEERAAAFDATRAVLVHGDAHGWNTLAADRGHKFVDPEGLASDPAHDLAVPMREYNEPLLAGDTRRLVHERAEALAAACDADPVAVWQWGLIERVSTGLANLRDFDTDDGLLFLEVATRSLRAS